MQVLWKGAERLEGREIDLGDGKAAFLVVAGNDKGAVSGEGGGGGGACEAR